MLVAVAPALLGSAASAGSRAAAPRPDIDWRKFHYDLANTGFNPNETILSPATVGDLQLKWKFQASGGIVSSPAVVDGFVYTGDNAGNVYAIDAATGILVWEEQHAGTYASDPAVADGIVYFGTLFDHQLHAYDALSGDPLWSYQLNGAVDSPTVRDGVVYAASDVGQVVALDAKSGLLRWMSSAFPGGVYGAMSVSGTDLYVGDDVARAFAIDLTTGRMKWVTRFLGAKVYGATAVSAGKIYFGATDNRVRALDARTGRPLWSGSTGNAIVSSPSVAYGYVYIGSEDGSVYAFPEKCRSPCSPAWTFATGNAIVGQSPVVADGVVYVGGNDGTAYALDARTGAELWSYPTGDIVDSTVIVNGSLYVGSFDGNLYAFGLSG